jgi:hypothetical protein
MKVPIPILLLATIVFIAMVAVILHQWSWIGVNP